MSAQASERSGMADNVGCILIEQLNASQWHVANITGVGGVTNWVSTLSLALDLATFNGLPVIAQGMFGDCRVMALGGGR